MAEYERGDLLARLARDITRREERNLRRRVARFGYRLPPTVPTRTVPFPEIRGTARGSPYDVAVRVYARQEGLTYSQARSEPGFKEAYKEQSLREQRQAQLAARYGGRGRYNDAVDRYALWHGKSVSETRSDPKFREAYKNLTEIENLREKIQLRGMDWRQEMDRMGLRRFDGKYNQALIDLGYKRADSPYLPGDTPRHTPRR